MEQPSATIRIAVVGSFNLDYSMRIERMPRPGETLTGGEMRIARGGKGANQAVAAARAGGQVAFVCSVGSDPTTMRACEQLRQEGIELFARQSADTATGSAIILVDNTGENSIAVAAGANGKLDRMQIEQTRNRITGAGICLCQLENPLDAVEAALKLAREAGVRTILNPAPAQPLTRALLKYVDVLTPNEHEAEAWTGEHIHGPDEAAKVATMLQAMGPACVIITLGAMGAYVAAPEYAGVIPGFRVDTVDTTAAGDTFNGALAVALIEGLPLAEAVRFANAAAALATTRPGAEDAPPRRREIEGLLLREQSSQHHFAV